MRYGVGSQQLEPTLEPGIEQRANTMAMLSPQRFEPVIGMLAPELVDLAALGQ